jgi:hypothetical protein
MANWIRIHSNILGVLYGILSYFVITQRWYIALGIGIGLGIYTNYFANYIIKKVNVKIGELMGSAVGQMFFKKK